MAQLLREPILREQVANALANEADARARLRRQRCERLLAMRDGAILLIDERDVEPRAQRR